MAGVFALRPVLAFLALLACIVGLNRPNSFSIESFDCLFVPGFAQTSSFAIFTLKSIFAACAVILVRSVTGPTTFVTFLTSLVIIHKITSFAG